MSEGTIRFEDDFADEERIVVHSRGRDWVLDFSSADVATVFALQDLLASRRADMTAEDLRGYQRAIYEQAQAVLGPANPRIPISSLSVGVAENALGLFCLGFLYRSAGLSRVAEAQNATRPQPERAPSVAARPRKRRVA